MWGGAGVVVVADPHWSLDSPMLSAAYSASIYSFMQLNVFEDWDSIFAHLYTHLFVPVLLVSSI